MRIAKEFSDLVVYCRSVPFREDSKYWILLHVIVEFIYQLFSLCVWHTGISAPPSKKRSICISDFMQTTFFYLERFLKKLADDQCSSITKGSITYIKVYGGLIVNRKFNGSIFYVLYLQILCFYLVEQNKWVSFLTAKVFILLLFFITIQERVERTNINAIMDVVYQPTISAMETTIAGICLMKGIAIKVSHFWRSCQLPAGG